MSYTQKYILGIIDKHKNKLTSKDIIPIPDELRDVLLDAPRYSKLASYPDIKVTCKTFPGTNRRYRAIALVTSTGKEIPVTKSRLKLSTGRKRNQKLSKREVCVKFYREAIQYQIDLFRANFRQVQREYGSEYPELLCCPLSGKKFWAGGKTHCDHTIPFSWLLEQWLLTQTSYKKIVDCPMTDYYADSWQKFHEKYAVLRLTSAKANIARGSEGYRSSI